MSHLALRAYWKLIFFDLLLARGSFADVYERIREYSQRRAAQTSDTSEKICTAVDMACIWYWKEVLCLQRSAATACLLKDNGISARMLIGVQQMPFKSHAWVEVDGRVVNDKPYMREIYAVIDEC
jgi:Transglutaminase-like superfamily